MNKSNTVVIMGNGPSLQKEYFELLRNSGIHTTGLNAAYRYWRLINWWPTYYCCYDYALTLSHRDEITQMILDKTNPIKQWFLLKKPTYKSLITLPNKEQTYFSNDIRKHPKYIEKEHNKDFFGWHQDPDDGKHPIKTSSTGAGSVRTMVELGYKYIILIGMDCYYPIQEMKNIEKETKYRMKIKETPKINPNYFWDAYQQAGDLYHTPGNHLNAWIELKQQLYDKNVNIINCSPGSKINMFSMAKFEDIIKQITN